MLHRLARDRAVARRVDAERAELARSTAWPLLVMTMMSMPPTRNTIEGRNRACDWMPQGQ
jgi:hypothetical protein